MEMRIPISIVVPTLNRPQALERTVRTVMKYHQPAQIVVVDQSADGETRNRNQAILNEYTGQADMVYIHQETPGTTKARNTGIRMCSNDCIVFMDDDVDVFPDTLFNVSELMADSGIAMIAGIDVNSAHANGKLGYLFGTKSFKNRRIGHVTRSMLGRYPNQVCKTVKTQWAMGYFFCVRKSLLEKWNVWFDEQLVEYAYAEDLDFSYAYSRQAEKNGMRCLLTDKVKVKHLVSDEYRSPTLKNTYMFVLHREYLSYKHHMGSLSRLAIRWTNFAYCIMRAVRGERPADIWQAQRACRRHRAELKRGHLDFYAIFQGEEVGG